MNTLLAIFDAILNTLWQTVVVAALVWLALKLMPRMNAATRYAIWWAALAVVLVLPVAPRLFTMMRPQPHEIAAKAPASLAPAPRPIVAEPVIVNIAPGRAARWPLAVLAVWGAILLFRCVQLVRSYFYLRGVKRRAAASPIPLPEIPRRADLLISRDVRSPMAVGFLRPAIILPESLLGELSGPEREHVLLHEAAHLAGYDDWSNLAMRILGAAMALHPVAIWILRRIEREREMVCDDWVVSRTTAAGPYAATLARLFEMRQAKRNEALASGIFGHNSKLGDRIEMLLRRGRTFSPRAASSRVIAGVVVLFGLMVAGSAAPRWIAFAEGRPSFEAASVKPNDSPNPADSVLFRRGGRFTATATLRMLIGTAYDVRNHQVAAGPNWIDSARFDIDARVGEGSLLDPGPGGANQMRAMVQSLLAERFKLALHRETREEQVYLLVVDRGGSKLIETKDTSRGEGTRGGKGEIRGVSAALPDLVYVLSQRLGHSVIDKTGLTAKYDFKLTWPPDRGVGSDDPAASSIFTAVRDDLGLKLEAAKAPVEVLVIDHVEKPDAN